jgi:hypothetical protein
MYARGISAFTRVLRRAMPAHDELRATLISVPLHLAQHPASTQPFSFPRRVFCARVLLCRFTHPMKGWAERRESSGACEAPVGPALSGQARRLARRLASPYGGRSPPGAPPWRFLAPVPRFPHRHSRRIGHSELLAPGRSARWRPPGPPGAAVMSRYRRTPLLAPHSGSSREHAPNERGWECCSRGAICSQ